MARKEVRELFVCIVFQYKIDGFMNRYLYFVFHKAIFNNEICTGQSAKDK